MENYSEELTGKYLYFGNIGTNEPQYKSGKFVGLALSVTNDREIKHSVYDPLPVPNNSVEKIQSQDVFEHLEYLTIPGILDDIYRALAPDGVFRLSVPDYHSPLLKKRTVFDEYGNPIGDMMMGTQIGYDLGTKKRKVVFRGNGNSHLWFPTYHLVLELIVKSQIRKCSQINFYHYFTDDENWKADPFPDNEMHVFRAPPFDKRADGKPISIIVDFVK
jgi:SAM-dependent methyltransferase